MGLVYTINFGIDMVMGVPAEYIDGRLQNILFRRVGDDVLVLFLKGSEYKNVLIKDMSIEYILILLSISPYPEEIIELILRFNGVPYPPKLYKSENDAMLIQVSKNV